MERQLRTPPKGVPIRQQEWDKLSETSRRWLMDAAAAVGARKDVLQPGAEGPDNAQSDEDEPDAGDGEQHMES